ncbi:MAG TPA: hypothetical protein VI698_04885 [Nitrososphaerales archaeon]|nr:hypothetical protein [Nitrososphaerales archaeon]
MSFTSMLNELRIEIESKKENMRSLVARNPQRAYAELNQIAYMVGAKYGAQLQFHFPDTKKITDVDSYGSENLGIVVDKHRKRFPIPRDSIKEKAKEILSEVDTKDAYMYEGKEGLKIFLKDGRIDILPGSVHLWCRIDDSVKKFVDWLMLECYQMK